MRQGSANNPPRLAAWVLQKRLAVEDRDCLMGDLAEEYRELRVPRQGRMRADCWYWGQALRSLAGQWLDRDPAPDQHNVGFSGETHDRRTGDSSMSNLLRDFRHGVRTLWQTPTFTAVCVITLALAIGVNTAIFSMFNVILFQPLPIEDPVDIGFFYFDHPERGAQGARMSEADFLDYRDRFTSFGELAAVNRGRSFIMSGLETPLQITGFEASANTFDVWRLEPILGRAFQPGEDEVGAPRVMLLSHGTWERRFGADPEVLGTTVKLNDYETTIVGVLGPEIEFGGLSVAEIWTPLYADRATASREVRNLWVSGRLVPGRSLVEAQQEANLLSQSLSEEYPETNAGWNVRVEDINGALGNDQMWLLFNMMMLTVLFVLAIACSNIATMMLSRASSRSKEIAVRAALGAGRGRILSQLFAESLLLSIVAGALGLAVTRLCLAGLVWMVGDNSGTNFFALLRIDQNVLLFTAVVAFAAPMMFGFLPALRASRTDLSETLKDSSRGSSGAGGLRGRRVLVATQVSLALALMVVAGLLARAVIKQRTFDLGFDIDNVVTMRVDLPDRKYAEEHQWKAFFDDALERVAGLPGVEDAAWMSARPLAEGDPSRPFLIEGEEIPAIEDLPFTTVATVDERAFEVLQLPMVSGRGFGDADVADGLPVVLVNQDMVERYWAGASPLGSRVRFGGAESTEPWLTVVGVMADTFSGNPDSPTFPYAAVPLEQNPRRGLGLLVRSNGDPLALVPSIREQVAAIDADQPLGDVRTLDQIFDDNQATADAMVSIFVVFAAFALVMAGTGIYGVLSFSVAQRTQEIGIRMALGAHGNEVVRMIGKQAAWLVGAGIVVGSIGSVFLGRILAASLVGVDAADPWALGFVALALLGAAALAIWIPTRRAVRVDPIIALRQE